MVNLRLTKYYLAETNFFNTIGTHILNQTFLKNNIRICNYKDYFIKICVKQNTIFSRQKSLKQLISPLIMISVKYITNIN